MLDKKDNLCPLILSDLPTTPQVAFVKYTVVALVSDSQFVGNTGRLLYGCPQWIEKYPISFFIESETV